MYPISQFCFFFDLIKFSGAITSGDTTRRGWHSNPFGVIIQFSLDVQLCVPSIHWFTPIEIYSILNVYKKKKKGT